MDFLSSSIRGEIRMKNKRSNLLVFAATLAVTISLFSCATSPKPSDGGFEKVPLPKDIRIVPPPADLPKEIAAFSGKWTGKWDGVQDSVLIVEEINDQEAKIILSQREYPGPIEEGYRRIIAKVGSSPTPNIEFEMIRSDHPVVTFQMQKDLNTIKGFWVYISDTWEDHLPIVYITMKRTH